MRLLELLASPLIRVDKAILERVGVGQSQKDAAQKLPRPTEASLG